MRRLDGLANPVTKISPSTSVICLAENGCLSCYNNKKDHLEGKFLGWNPDPIKTRSFSAIIWDGEGALAEERVKMPRPEAESSPKRQRLVFYILSG